jgi:hypothetical protein
MSKLEINFRQRIAPLQAGCWLADLAPRPARLHTHLGCAWKRRDGTHTM